MKSIVLADPRNCDVAVPQTPTTLKNIMKHYPWSWERASNGPYFVPGKGWLLGLVAERGNVYKNYDWSGITDKWPALFIKNGKAWIQTGPKGARDADSAIGAGPLIVEKGQVSNIEANIHSGGFSGFDTKTRYRQVAVGVTAESKIVHGVWDSATLYEVAHDMKEAGCVTAMKFDGGGSVGVLEKTPTGSKLIAGTDSGRALPAAFVVREIEKRISLGDKPRICIDPGHGGPDPGACFEGYMEKHFALSYCLSLEYYLKRLGWDVVLTRRKDVELVPGMNSWDELVARAGVSNGYNADLFLSIHLNSASNKSACGREFFHYPRSQKGTLFANTLEEYVSVVSQDQPLRRIAGAGFVVLKVTWCPAVLEEIGFMTNPSDMALIKKPDWLDKRALAEAFAIDSLKGVIV